MDVDEGPDADPVSDIFQKLSMKWEKEEKKWANKKVRDVAFSKRQDELTLKTSLIRADEEAMGTGDGADPQASDDEDDDTVEPYMEVRPLIHDSVLKRLCSDDELDREWKALHGIVKREVEALPYTPEETLRTLETSHPMYCKAMRGLYQKPDLLNEFEKGADDTLAKILVSSEFLRMYTLTCQSLSVSPSPTLVTHLELFISKCCLLYTSPSPRD